MKKLEIPLCLWGNGLATILPLTPDKEVLQVKA